MDKPFFSILVPIYNVEKYLKECLDSVIAQTYTDYEVIIVNDGSTDNSFAIAQEYVLKDNRFKIISQENSGLFYSRQILYKNSIGKYCIYLDSDDKLKNELVLEKIKSVIDREKCDIVQFEYERFNDLGNITRDKSLNNESCVLTVEEYFLYFNTNAKYNNIWSKAFKRELFDFDKISCYPKINMGEDLIYTINIARKAKTIFYINEVFYQYRTNTNSMSYKFYDEPITNKLLPYVELRDISKEILGVKHNVLCETYFLKNIATLILYSSDNIKNKEKQYISMCRQIHEFMGNRYEFLNDCSFIVKLPIRLLKKERYRTLLFFKKILQNKFVNRSMRKIMAKKNGSR